MSYTSTTDFLALLRTLSDGSVRLASMPGVDWMLSALARAGMVSLWVNPATGPSSNQSTTVWLKSSASSWATEGSAYLWDIATLAYQPATPALWARLFQAAMTLSSEVTASSSLTLTGAQSGSLYTNTGSPTIEYTLPPAAKNPGVVYEFAVTALGLLNILLSSGDTIYFGNRNSVVGVSSTYVGSYLKVRSLNGQWFVVGAEGTWVLS